MQISNTLPHHRYHHLPPSWIRRAGQGLLMSQEVFHLHFHKFLKGRSRRDPVYTPTNALCTHSEILAGYRARLNQSLMGHDLFSYPLGIL